MGDGYEKLIPKGMEENDYSLFYDAIPGPPRKN
jgi:hypothetical protein